MSLLPALPPEEEPSSLQDDVPAATRRRAALAAGMRHDIKHSKQVAQLALGAVAGGIDDPDAQAKIAGALAALEDVSEHALKALELLTLGAEAIEPQRAPVPLDQILIAVEAARRDSAERAGMTLRSVPSGVIAHTDRTLLQRCLGNLLTNAIRHSGGKRVLIGVRRRGDGCAIEVRDDGRGLSPAALSMMSQRHAGDASGRGLGLWITRTFARALGGELTVRSDGTSGTCFALRLPGPLERLAGAPRAAAATAVRLDNQVVVVLDDDADVLTETGILLRRRGATVIAALNEIDFWVEVQQQPKMPSLFIIDFVLGPATAVGKVATTRNCLSALKQRYRAKLKAAIVTADPAHPALREVSDIPIFEKPMTDDLLDAIIAAVRPGTGSQAAGNG